MSRMKSVHPEPLKKCLDELNAILRDDFFDESESTLPPEEREEKYRTHVDYALHFLWGAIPEKNGILGQNPRKKRKRKVIRVSREDIYGKLRRMMFRKYKDRYNVTKNKVYSILNDITGGMEKGEGFIRVREHPPRYMYKPEIAYEVQKKIRLQGVSTAYIQKQLGLTHKTYYTFVEDLCRRTFKGGCDYLPLDSSVAKFFRKKFTWNEIDGKPIPKDQKDAEKGRICYGFTYKIFLELKKILVIKNAFIASEKNKKENENPKTQ